MHVLIRFRFPILLALALVAAFNARPALALNEADAERIVLVLETLSPKLGTPAYDEEMADGWFDEAEGARIILSRGFDRASWKTALDATMRGYLAALPQAEIDDLFRQMRARLARTPRMTGEQRAAMNDWIDEEQADLAQLRREGMPYAAIIGPLVPRLRRLLPSGLVPE